jgi:hypothetical protein
MDANGEQALVFLCIIMSFSKLDDDTAIQTLLHLSGQDMLNIYNSDRESRTALQSVIPKLRDSALQKHKVCYVNFYRAFFKIKEDPRAEPWLVHYQTLLNAVRRDHIKSIPVISGLIPKEYGGVTLQRAIGEREAPLVRTLLDEEVSKPGQVSLIEACKVGDTEIVRLLLDAGAPIDVNSNFARDA